MVRRQWIVLVWVAGDNDLESFGEKDIAEMKAAVQPGTVDVLVQFDKMSDGNTRRYHLRHGTSLDEDELADLGETNTGDPAVATDFLTWGIQQYPADHVMAVIWNHGSGIDETDVYATAGRAGVGRGGEIAARARRIASSQLRRAVFATTIEAALRSKAIAYDDTSKDFLDNAELKQVLVDVVRRTGRPIDVLGFDACLMSMLEVAYQLRGLAGFIVSSQELEPGDGWPYDRVIRALVDDPSQEPRALAGSIVPLYIDSYPPGETLTLSAVDVARVEDVATAVDELAAALIAGLETAEDYAVLTKALIGAQRFDRRDFVDLVDFCGRIAKGSTRAEVRAALATVSDLVSTAERPFVVRTGSRGPRVARATGTAVYFPTSGDVQVVYEQLDFAQDTRWGQLISRYREV